MINQLSDDVVVVICNKDRSSELGLIHIDIFLKYKFTDFHFSFYVDQKAYAIEFFRKRHWFYGANLKFSDFRKIIEASLNSDTKVDKFIVENS